MFLHSGASLHGHEYSNRPAPAGQQNANKRSPLLRSAFAKPRPVSLDGGRPPLAVQARRPLSELAPRLPEPAVRFLEPDDEKHLPPAMASDVASVLSMSELSDGSAPSEAATVTSSSHRRRRRSRASSRAARTSTTLALAYPAPRFAGKKRVVQKVLPKLYLQLQVVSPDKRPRPVVDVFPSSRIAGPVIAPRLAKRFPGLFGPKGELGSADVVLMRSEDYDAASPSADDDSDDEDGRLGQRQPIAVLSPVKKSDRTEIVLDDGSVWVARPLPTGSFDFERTDEHGLTTTARWARRPCSKAAAAPAPDASRAGRSSTPEPPDVKYTFSIINPDSRRHPVMATLTPSFLEIQDTYTAVSTSSSRYPPPPNRASLGVRSASTPTSPSDSLSPAASPLHHPEPAAERTVHPVDAPTKLLISVTAVFLALESGWSPFYKPHAHHVAADHDLVSAAAPVAATDTSPRSGPGGPAAALRAACRTSSDEARPAHAFLPVTLRRAASTTVAMAAAVIPSPTPPPAASSSTTAAVPPTPPIFRDLSPIRTTPPPPAWWETSPSSTTTAAAPQQQTTPSRGAAGAAPRRATSTGAAFMRRARLASAQQHQHSLALAESSDSEHHAPAAPGKEKRRSRVVGGADGERGREGLAERHSIAGALPLAVAVDDDGRVAVVPEDDGVGVGTVRRSAARELAKGAEPMVMMAPRREEVAVELGGGEPGERRGGLEGRIKSVGRWFRRLGRSAAH